MSHEDFENLLLKFMRTTPNSLFNVSHCFGIKLHARLCLGLIRLREHKFNDNFKDIVNSLCSSV